jgi:hypothetical protein
MNWLWQGIKCATKDYFYTFWEMRWVYIGVLTCVVGFDGGMLIGWWIDKVTK